MSKRGYGQISSTKTFTKKRKSAISKPKKSLRFQVNTLHGKTPESKEITQSTTTISLAAGSTAFTAIGQPNHLNALLQGTSAESRIGRKIRMRSLDLRWNFTFSAVTISGGGCCRGMLVNFVQPTPREL